MIYNVQIYKRVTRDAGLKQEDGTAGGQTPLTLMNKRSVTLLFGNQEAQCSRKGKAGREVAPPPAGSFTLVGKSEPKRGTTENVARRATRL